jgi:hypothetical protein
VEIQTLKEDLIHSRIRDAQPLRTWLGPLRNDPASDERQRLASQWRGAQDYTRGRKIKEDPWAHLNVRFGRKLGDYAFLAHNPSYVQRHREQVMTVMQDERGQAHQIGRTGRNWWFLKTSLLPRPRWVNFIGNSQYGLEGFVVPTPFYQKRSHVSPQSWF